MKSKQKNSFTLPLSSGSNGKWMMLSLLLAGLLVATTQAVDQKSVKPPAVALPSSLSSGAAGAAASPSTLATRDEIYIDDDSNEGSGGRGGIHEDLEKDPDYSGSGFGPDDEDAITDHHGSHGSHNTRISQIGGSSSNTNTHTPTTPSSTPTPTQSSSSTTSSTTQTPNTTTTSTSTLATPAITSSTTPVPVPVPVPTSPQIDETEDGDEDDLELPEEGSGDDNNDDDDDDDDDGGDIVDPEDPYDQLPIDHDIKVQTPVDASGHVEVDEGTIDVDGKEDDEDMYTEITKTSPGTVDVDDGDINIERGPGGGGSSNVHELNPHTDVNSQPTDQNRAEHRPTGNEVVIMSDEDRTTSFFAQPGILAAVIGGAVVGLLCAILVVMFIVYRMRKKDEGSYALDEPKRSPANNSYAKNGNNREFYA